MVQYQPSTLLLQRLNIVLVHVPLLHQDLKSKCDFSPVVAQTIHATRTSGDKKHFSHIRTTTCTPNGELKRCHIAVVIKWCSEINIDAVADIEGYDFTAIGPYCFSKESFELPITDPLIRVSPVIK